MTGRSHLIIGLLAGAAAALALKVDNQTAVLMALAGGAGGLIPDLDHPKSMLSGWIPGMGIILGLSRVGHRTLTHSLVFVALVWLVANATLPYQLAVAVALGVVSHIAADMTTPKGIPLLYPLSGAWVVLPRFVLSWGGAWLIETLACAAAIVSLFVIGYEIIK